jgi:F-type H+-transporting ATPase subunit b
MVFSGSGRKLLATPVFTLIVLVLGLTGEAFAAGISVMPNWTTFIQAANFIVLVFILNIVLYRPIRQILIQRKEKFNGLEQSIANLAQDLTDKESSYAAGIREARKKGVQRKNEMVLSASEEEKQLIEKINAEALESLNAIREQVAAEADAARKALQQEVDSFANQIGAKILGRTV